MGKYILQRLVYMFITLFIIATATFFLMKLMPGSPFNDIAAKASEEQLALLEAKYGLDEPVPVQYVKYIAGIVQGDFGISFQFNNREVGDLIMNRIGPSAQLGAQAMIVGTILGILLGMVAAIRHNTWVDYVAGLIAIIGISIPSFVFAGLMQYYIGQEWGLLPVALWGDFKHTIMPTIALLIFPMAIAARFMRTEMMEVLGSDYIELARAKGLPKGKIMYKHAMRNALIPVITVIGPMTVGMMTGTLVIEQIFAVPGLGEQFVRSINTNDYPMIMGTTMFFAILFVAVILVVDLLYGVIDPRIRITGGKN